MTQKESKCPICGRVIYFEGICYDCRQRQKREAYQTMTDAEVDAKIEAILAALALGGNFYKKDESCDFPGLLAYKNISTERFAHEAARAGVYYPEELYRDARPADLDTLIGLLAEPVCEKANDILPCLAIAGGEKVLAAFLEFERNPRPWTKKLYAPLSVCAQAGGWSFSPDGRRIELNYDVCFPVLPVSEGEKTDDAVLVATPREDVCPECGSKLIDILTIDGGDDRLAFLGLNGVVRVPVCPICATMCERTIVRYALDGDSDMELIDPFGAGDKIADEEYAAMTANKFALAKEPASLFFSRGCDESAITVGGFAAWVQDYQYDICPDCGRAMRYFASVPWSALSDYSEGTLFLEICPDCRVISAFHQQT